MKAKLKDNTQIQLIGDYRELCIVAAAKLLVETELKPIITDNAMYSISAIYSVQEGDTLESRINVVVVKYINFYKIVLYGRIKTSPINNANILLYYPMKQLELQLIILDSNLK